MDKLSRFLAVFGYDFEVIMLSSEIIMVQLYYCVTCQLNHSTDYSCTQVQFNTIAISQCKHTQRAHLTEQVDRICTCPESYSSPLLWAALSASTGAGSGRSIESLASV